jgi:DNA-binding cell septation regulator SpoVG
MYLNKRRHRREPKKLKEVLDSVINNLKRRNTMVTVSRLHRLNNGSQVKAFADVVFYRQIMVKGVKVVASKDNTLFVAMPSQKSKEGKWGDTVALLDDMSKEQLRTAVLSAYNT